MSLHASVAFVFFVLREFRKSYVMYIYINVIDVLCCVCVAAPPVSVPAQYRYGRVGGCSLALFCFFDTESDCVSACMHVSTPATAT